MFIIPMAGLSSRFFKAGFSVPKYQLTLGSETVFSWSVKSFKNYFESDKFIFIYRDIFDTRNFILSEISSLKIKNFEIICLDDTTKGQADTVYQGLLRINSNEELFIFNIDSKIKNFIKPNWLTQCDGYLEVFKGEGDNWSFVEPKNRYEVLRTTEKERISDLCSDGLYYFKSRDIYIKTFLEAQNKKYLTKGEYYIAPLYNLLIKNNAKILYYLTNQNNLQFCGTPTEYNDLNEEMKNEKNCY